MNEQNDPPRLVETEPRSVLGVTLSFAVRDLPADGQLAKLADRLEPLFGSTTALHPSGVVKLGAVAGVVAALIAGSVVTRQPAPRAAAPRPASATPSVAVGTAAPPAPSTVSEPTEKNAGSSAESPASSAMQPPSVKQAQRGSKPSEAELLEHARRALASDPASALALTQRDSSLYPNGALTQEREVIAIEALRRLNLDAEAERRASEFERAFPGSAHERVIEAAEPK